MALSVQFHHYQLLLKHPFAIARYTVNAQDTVIVSISDGIHTGYGEVTVNLYYESTIEKIIKSIQRVTPIIEGSKVKHPALIWQDIEPFLLNDYFTLCALDCAYWDLYAKINHKTLRSFWAGHTNNTPLTSYTIGIDTIANMQAKIVEKPWPIYKIKLGTSNDLEIIKALRKVTGSVFRIDANASWTIDETLKNIEALQRLHVEFIEQPLHVDDWDGMKFLKDRSVLPIIADESCQRFEDIDTCAEVFHGINIKLMKCGGFTPAFEMIKRARNYYLKVMVGCMTESSVGISNVVQFSSLVDYLDADGAMLLKNDIAQGVYFKDGKVVFSEANGSGATLL